MLARKRSGLKFEVGERDSSGRGSGDAFGLVSGLTHSAGEEISAPRDFVRRRGVVVRFRALFPRNVEVDEKRDQAQGHSETGYHNADKGDLLKSLVVVDEVSHSQEDEGDGHGPQHGQPLQLVVSRLHLPGFIWKIIHP